MIGLPVCVELRSAGPFDYAQGRQPRAAVPTYTCFLFCGLSAIRLTCPKIVPKIASFLGNSLGSSIGAAHVERGFRDDLAQRVQMVEGFFGGGVAEDYGELFAAAAEGLAIASDIR